MALTKIPGSLINSADNLTITDLTVTGNLNITGDINSYNVTDLDVTDQTITLGAGQTEALSGGSGIIVDGSNASILWDETNTEWDFNNGINVAGNIQTNGIYRAYDSVSTNYRNVLGYDSGNVKLQTGTGSSSYGISLFTAGTERLTINGSGFVGIGADSPASKLHIAASSYTAPTGGLDPNINLLINNTQYSGIQILGSSAGSSFIHFGDQNDANIGIITYEHNGDYMRFDVNATERMRIDSDGNVLIGTQTTNANGLLQVNGSIGLLGTTEIRPATNLDTSSLSILSQNVIIGTLNSLAYTYSGGAQFASISSSGSKRVLDVGANNTSGHRLQIDNDAGGVNGTLKYKSGTQNILQVDSSSERVGVRVADGSLDCRFQIDDIGDKTVSNFGDSAFLRNITNGAGNYVQIGFSTNDSDGQHHRAVIRATKDSRANYGGVFQVRTRTTASGFDLEESLTIGALGEVTMPRQPMAMVDSNASWTNYTGGQAVIFNRAPINVGSCYNTSNGRFTAPVAGKYLVLVSMYTRAQNASSFTITLNGSQTGNSDVVPLLYRSQNGTVENTHVMQNLYDLSANDYLIIACRVSMSGTIYMGHSSASFIKVG